MSYFIFTAQDGTHYRHDENPSSVTILDSAMQPLSATFPTDDFDSTVSVRSNTFARGSSADLLLHDLRSGELKASFPFRRIGPVAAFDESGTRLLFKTGSQIVLLNVESGEATQVDGLRQLDGLVIANKEFVVRSPKKGELLRVSLHTGAVSVVTLPINATLFDLKRSPSGPHWIAIDRQKCVHCIDTSDWSIVWSQSLKKEIGKDHMGVGQFSGDGNLFGAAIAAYDHNYTIVLDAHTGKQVSRFGALCYGLPHRGSLVRDDSTRANTFVADTVDLATGQEGSVTLPDLST